MSLFWRRQDGVDDVNNAIGGTDVSLYHRRSADFNYTICRKHVNIIWLSNAYLHLQTFRIQIQEFGDGHYRTFRLWENTKEMLESLQLSSASLCIIFITH